MRSCSLFLVVLTMFLTAAPVMSNCPPKQFCSRCPRMDNAGHSLQGEPGEAGYVHCQYKDTDCRYGPRSETINLASSYPAGACPGALGPSVCSDALPPPPRQLLGTTCPPMNQGFIYVPLRSQPSNSPYTQCHYGSSECYYDPGGSLVPALSIPVDACPPRNVADHLQYVQ